MAFQFLRAASFRLPLVRVISRPSSTSSFISTRSAQPPAAASPPEAVSVFISQSQNIFTNLALEDWLYRNVQFGRHAVLLLWRNQPCVVIGRHQNPWQEVGDRWLRDRPGAIARRCSGGGCVYHDPGNLNLTFFTSRQQYDRRSNLQLVADTLQRTWGLDVALNARDDVLLQDKYKISGTAAKLTRNVAYHHCTLMVNVELAALRESLASKPSELDSNATASVPSSVANLSTGNPAVSMEAVISALGRAYLQKAGSQANRGFQLINPTDEWFPGLGEIERSLSDRQWVYGRTPAFSHTFRISGCSGVRVCVRVEKGRVVSAVPVPPNNTEHSGLDWVRSILPSACPEQLQTLVGLEYSTNIAQQAESALLGIIGGDAALPANDKRLLAL